MTTTETSTVLDRVKVQHHDLGRVIAHLEAHADALAATGVYVYLAAGTTGEVDLQCTSDEALAAATRVVQAGAAPGDIKIERGADSNYVRVKRQFGTAVLEAWAERDVACTRRVVGTRTEMVPDPDAPLVAREVEIIEWDCHPLLAGDR